MNKKPLENYEQQEATTESALFRLWSRFKDKKSAEKTSDPDPSSDAQTASEEPEQNAESESEPQKNDMDPVEETDAVNEPAPEQISPTQVSQGKQEPAADNQKPQEQTPDGEEGPEQPVDAQIQLKIAKDQMTASAVVLPPQNGGADITEEMLQECLKEHGVLEEFFSSSGMKMLCTFKLYHKSAVLAKGIRPVPGTNGHVEELFKREHDICLETDENGLVNYKNLNKLRIVKKGTVICKITPPEPPVDGKDLFGKEVAGRPGKPVNVHVGKNTALSEDGTELTATCAGNLRFSKETFFVEDVLHIQADVDNAIGNLDFCGDVIIDGGVREGFSVQSDKNITIKGSVEGAFINAKGNITLKKGINGMGRGLLRAGGDVKCKFLENCTVNAGGSVIAECIMNSRVTAEDEVLVEGGKGTIMGGTCTARNRIKAKYVGSPASVATTIVLGASPEIIAQKKQLSKKIELLKKEVDNLEKSCRYLERSAKKTPLNKERASQLSQMKKQRMMSSVQLSIDSKQLFELDELIESLDSCKLSCLQIYPPVKILMANESLQVKESESRRMYYYDSGEIKIGSI